jgi:hypothetical protein
VNSASAAFEYAVAGWYKYTGNNQVIEILKLNWPQVINNPGKNEHGRKQTTSWLPHSLSVPQSKLIAVHDLLLPQSQRVIREIITIDSEGDNEISNDVESGGSDLSKWFFVYFGYSKV